MKPIRAVSVFCIVFLLASTAWSGPPAAMSVQVQTGQVRSEPSFLGAVLASLAYGDRIDVIGQQGDWMEVAVPGGSRGWMHRSALTKKKVVLNAGWQDVGTGASSDELALAGKGFNAETEGLFRERHRQADFLWVDRMERFVVYPEEMLAFLKEGGVKPLKGGAR
ncbi:MAG: SH3 domain-containing protein [Syntrophobacteraceae bacterium]|nr:SH3 domain-containing protein [Syntrophobacteraceae bacterium]